MVCAFPLTDRAQSCPRGRPSRISRRAPELKQPRRHDIDMRCGRSKQIAAGGIAPFRMGDNKRGEAGIVAWSGAPHPPHDRIGVGFKLLEDGPQKVGPGPQPVVRSKDLPQDFIAKPGSAALIGKRKTPTSDPEFPPACDAPSDAAGADDDDAAVSAGVCANTCRSRIACEDRTVKGQR